MSREPLKLSDRIGIAPGCYKLVRDVPNPKPDRRSSRDWTKAQFWRAGDAFIVFGNQTRDLADVIDDETLRGTHVPNGYQYIQRVGSSRYDVLMARDVERWNALVIALEPTEETWETFWLRTDVHGFLGGDFIRHLVERELLTREQVAAEFAAWLISIGADEGEAGQ